MSIYVEDIVWRYSQARLDAPSNGGTMTHIQIPSGSLNSLFKAIMQPVRVAGYRGWRKCFVHAAHPSNEGMGEIRVHLYEFPAGDANVFLHLGTQTDVEDDLSANPRLHGIGVLRQVAVVGSTSVTITTQGGTYQAFQVGDVIRIFNYVDETDITGSEAYRTVTEATWNGDDVELSFSEPLSEEFTTVRDVGGVEVTTRVASCITQTVLKGSVVAGPIATSATGSVESTGENEIVVDAVGGVADNYTITFSSGSAFSCTNGAGDNIGSGNRSSVFQPLNPHFAGRPYFILPPEFWQGTWAAGDTLTFSTEPPAIPLWYYLDLPPNAEAVATSMFNVWFTGHTLTQ